MKRSKTSRYDNLGDKIERVGEKIGGKLGRFIYGIGNKLEHMGEKSSRNRTGTRRVRRTS